LQGGINKVELLVRVFLVQSNRDQVSGVAGECLDVLRLHN
jgi:hypothetical protein